MRISKVAFSVCSLVFLLRAGGVSFAAEMPVVPPSELGKPGKLTICTDIPVPPYSMLDPAGESYGIDPDLGREIGRRLSLTPNVVDVVFNTIIPALQSQKCDIIMSSMLITAERQKVISQIPYSAAGQSFAVPKNNPKGIKTTLDLCGRRVAAQTGSVGVDHILGGGDYKGKGYQEACQAASKPPIVMSQYSKISDTLLAVMSGQADVSFIDSGATALFIQQNKDVVEASAIPAVDPAPLGIGLAMAHPGLKKAVEAALSATVADGTYQKIFDKYGFADGALLTKH